MIISPSAISPYKIPTFQSGGGFDPATSAIIAQMTANGSTPTEARQLLINQLVLDLKGLGNTGSDDIFSRFEYLNVFAAEDETQALTEWVTANGTIDAINVNSTAFTVDIGYTGENLRTIRLPKVLNTATKYLQDSASVGFYGTPASISNYVMGSNVSSRTYIRTGTAATDQTLNSTAGANMGFGSISRGLFIINRNNSTQFSTIKNKAIVSTNNINSTGRPSIPQVVFGLSTGATTFIASNASQAEIVFAASAVDDVLDQLNDSFNAYLNAL
jgi:hypothetical protein